MSATSVSIPVRTPLTSSPHEAIHGPVLAVITENCAASSTVLERAAVLASEFDIGLHVALLHRPTGFTTDAALLGRLARQRHDELHQLLDPIRHRLPSVRATTTQRAWPAGRPWRRAARTWRTAERVVRSRGAHLVVVPRCVVAPLAGTRADVPLLVVDDPNDVGCQSIATAARR